MTRPQIGVFIVDDSAVVRQVLTARLRTDPGVNVIGCASDPIFAIEAMKREWPDVIVLDLEMPRMDGLTFLKQIMATRPTPVVICSTLTQRGAETTMHALAAGAVTVVPKPTTGLKKFIEDDSGDILAAVKAAAAGNATRLRTGSSDTALAVNSDPRRARPQALSSTTDRVVAIGTSTGGTQALETVLTALPRVCAGIVVVQHMPEKFTAAFAERLDSLCEVEVREAADGDRVLTAECSLLRVVATWNSGETERTTG